MKRELPPHVYRKRNAIWFVRRGRDSRKIESPFPSPEFWAEYAKIMKGTAPVPQGKTWRHLIADYKRSRRFAKLAPRTRSDYDKVLTFIESKMGNADPRKIERRHIIALRDANDDAVRFANYCVQVIRVVLEHAVDTGWIKENPAKGVGLIQSERDARKPWPADLIAKYRDAADGRALLLFELCLGTGQRIGDVLRMRWSDIEDGAIRVRQSKTKRELLIPFTPSLARVLADTPKEGLTIVAGEHGKPLNYWQARHAIAKVRGEIGAEAYDIHALRHTATSELAALGLSDELIQAVTGHTSTASVRRYSEAARQKARAREAQSKRS